MSFTKLMLAATAASCALLASFPAMAASDYLLTFDDVTGPTTIELASWSFGTSHPIASEMASGKRQHQPFVRFNPPSPGNDKLSVVTAREAGSGMATGRRSCATGKHFPKATLTNRSQSWTLADVTVSTCEADGMTLTYRAVQAGSPAASDAAVVRSKSNISNN